MTSILQARRIARTRPGTVERPTPTPQPARRSIRKPVVGQQLAVLSARRRRRPGSFVASLTLHGVILTALALTRQEALQPTTRGAADTTLVFLMRLGPPRVEHPPASAPLGPGGGGVSATPGVLVVANPPPRGFQTVVPPTDIPTVIPPIDRSQRTFDPKNYTGRGVEGGVAWGISGGTGEVDLDAVAGVSGELYSGGGTGTEQFTAARIVSQPKPVYPTVLKEAGIMGSVRLEFVVDTLGGVEPRSLRVLESSHAGFEEAARRTILESRFTPARLGDRTARQLTVQRINFVIAQ